MTITTRGLQEVAQIVADAVSYGVVGDDGTIPAANDLNLGNEITRQMVSSAMVDGEQIEIRTFIPNSDLPAISREAGVFIGGTDAANSGVLLDHSLINFTKNTNDLLYIARITFEEA